MLLWAIIPDHPDEWGSALIWVLHGHMVACSWSLVMLATWFSHVLGWTELYS
jgi:hypothetical protein